MEIDRCRELRVAYPDYALGVAESGIQLRIQEHLRDGCSVCSSEIDMLMVAFHTLPGAFAPHPLPDGADDAMGRRIGATPQEVLEQPIVFPETNDRRLAWTLVLLCLLALLAAAWWGRSQTGRVAMAERSQRTAELQTRRVVDDFRGLQDQQRVLQESLDDVTNPLIRAADLVPRVPGSRGRIFLDLRQGRLTLTVTGLPPAEAQEAYVVWMQPASGGAASGAAAPWTRLGQLEARIAEGGGGRRLGVPETAALPLYVAVSRERTGGEPPDHPLGVVVLDAVVEPLPGE